MNSEEKSLPQHDWPKAHEHLFGPWEPMGVNSKWRACVHPDCHYYESKTV